MGDNIQIDAALIFKAIEELSQPDKTAEERIRVLLSTLRKNLGIEGRFYIYEENGDFLVLRPEISGLSGLELRLYLSGSNKDLAMAEAVEQKRPIIFDKDVHPDPHAEPLRKTKADDFMNVPIYIPGRHAERLVGCLAFNKAKGKLEGSAEAAILHYVIDAVSNVFLAEETSKRDALTGLWKREYFEQRLREEVELLFRHPAEQRTTPLTVIINDIGGLKLVNDIFGQNAGDYVLRNVAGAISKSIRPSDVAARGGSTRSDEFYTLMIGNGTSGPLVMERVHRALEEPDENAKGYVTPATIEMLKNITKYTLAERAATLVGIQRVFRIDVADMLKAAQEGREEIVLGILHETISGPMPMYAGTASYFPEAYSNKPQGYELDPELNTLSIMLSKVVEEVRASKSGEKAHEITELANAFADRLVAIASQNLSLDKAEQKRMPLPSLRYDTKTLHSL